MRGSKVLLLTLTLGMAGMGGLYYFGTRPAEKALRQGWFNSVVKSRVHQAKELQTTAADSFMLGIFRPEIPYDLSEVFTIQDSLGTRFSLVSFYQAWGDEQEHEFPLEVCRNLEKGGFTPLITWEPWVVAFEGYADSAPSSSLPLIWEGTFDWYIRQWARECVRYQKPLFVRMAHEVSNGWYSWSSSHGHSPEAYERFWRHVHRIFTEQGARNVAFVWTPFMAGDTAYYPGDDVVDWIGLDIFNYGTQAVDGWWMDFYTMTKLMYDGVGKFGKPMLLAEVCCSPMGGNRPLWYRDMFHSLDVKNFPLIRGLVFFDTPRGTSPTGQKVDLGFSTDPEIYDVLDIKKFNKNLKIAGTE